MGSRCLQGISISCWNRRTKEGVNRFHHLATGASEEWWTAMAFDMEYTGYAYNWNNKRAGRANTKNDWIMDLLTKMGDFFTQTLLSHT